MHTALQDLRSAARALRRTPGFPSNPYFRLELP